MPRQNFLSIVLVGAVSILCWQNSQGAKPKDEMMELYGQFVDAVEQVEANYVRPVSRKDLLEGALRGMLADLDPHSSYFSESDWKQFRKQIEGSFTGIGVTIDIDPETERLKVIAPIVGSPAYEAGIMAGDQILEVNGESTEGWTREKSVEKLQGKSGSTVKLTVLHPNAEKTETISIRRAIIELPSVLGDLRKPDDSWDFMLDKANKIGYIRITSFIQNTADDLKKVLAELKEQGMKGLILDLRDDPGGLLSAAVEVSDLFVEEGTIVSTKGRNTREKIYEAEKEGTYTDFPMVVLINRHSASASEIVAACLQDHKRAVVVGERSYGKGSVQNILPLDNGDAVLKLTVATYWRPSGKNIHRFKNAKESDEWGVKPDPGLKVELDEDEYKAWALMRRDRDLISSHNQPKSPPKESRIGPPNDRQLDKALAVLKEKMKSEGATARK
ncbi:MAG: S41 family peptidase [Isosphaeraceae bacterium]|nr:S41 family peptidase [Isosphaeraceae bacterium]